VAARVRTSDSWYSQPAKGRDQIAITIPINGSEDLELEKRSAEKAVSLPVYVITTCGFDQWRLEAERSRQVRPPGGATRLSGGLRKQD
jgi:hypothetical protein